MIEVKHLYKTYRPKKGVPVVAANDISMVLPDTGMVFLLGKSGSGKSTLLNLIGGLDKYDSGDIVIKGTSTKEFRQSHFDSYRNTYIGFIFQEYNVLEEFTVGANIALAIELQGRKATNEEINAILKEVDLEGYGNRRPNELSGGQLQRVAIARALVKNPEIIFADEPTGALDSNTGKQVFETLKKLSKSKLVVIVSHDREFAEGYADRIIELADGKIISDVELSSEGAELKPAVVYNSGVIEVPAEYELTEEDLHNINDYLRNRKSGATIRTSETKAARFTETDESRIVSTITTKFKLIKSKLPMKNAFKIGAGALKHKKIRLAFTLLLSIVSFLLFGLADAFASYDNINACTESIYASKVTYASMSMQEYTNFDLLGVRQYRNVNMKAEDIAELEQKTGLSLIGVSYNGYSSLSMGENFAAYKSNQLYRSSATGYVTTDAAKLAEFGYTVIGRLPENNSEVAITEYQARAFKEYGYTYNGTKSDIKSSSDMLGKKLNIVGLELTVTGVVDTGLDIDRYADMINGKPINGNAEALKMYVILQEMSYEIDSSLGNVIFVTADFRKSLYSSVDISIELNHDGDVGYIFGYMNGYTTLDKVNGTVHWLTEGKTKLEKNEVLVYEGNIYGNLIDDPDGNATTEEIVNMNLPFKLTLNSNISSESTFSANNIKIVGYITDSTPDDDPENATKEVSKLVISDALVKSIEAEIEKKGNEIRYSSAVGAMPDSKAEIRKLVKFCYDEDADVRYPLSSNVTYQCDILREVLAIVAKAFVYIGIFYAIFASILMATFIASSVSYKKHEIGILRAIGSRSNDVFRIFFAEAFIIAMFNFLVSAVGTWIVTIIINLKLRDVGLLVSVISFGPRQIILLLLVSVAVALIASFIPVKKIASKKPIDAIRKR